jgi:hypothetical protein
MDAIFPGTFSMAKVKFGAKHDYEFVENYKILQNAFDKNGVKRHIDVSIIFSFYIYQLIYFRSINLLKLSIKII